MIPYCSISIRLCALRCIGLQIILEVPSMKLRHSDFFYHNDSESQFTCLYSILKNPQKNLKNRVIDLLKNCKFEVPDF